jgi:hypothetical protein
VSHSPTGTVKAAAASKRRRPNSTSLSEAAAAGTPQPGQHGFDFAFSCPRHGCLVMRDLP